MSNIKGYPKILPASGKFADYIVGNHCEITEKVDGSQFAFGKDYKGKLHMRSKGALIAFDEDNVQQMFRPAVDYVLSIADSLPFDTVYYGETLSKPKHNSLQYDRIPKNHIALYGVTDFEQTFCKARNWADLNEWARSIDVEPVALLFEGTISNLEEIKKFLGTSALGGQPAEGVVIKNYAATGNFFGGFQPLVAMKYVTEAFKEVHSSNPEYSPNKSKTENLMERYRSPARWHKAVQHLTEKGEIQSSPRDIGPLLKELNRDLEVECEQEIKDALWEIYRKDFLRTATRGFPEWYKQQLLKAEPDPNLRYSHEGGEDMREIAPNDLSCVALACSSFG